MQLSTSAGSGFSSGVSATCAQCLVLDAMAAPEAAGCSMNCRFWGSLGQQSIGRERIDLEQYRMQRKQSERAEAIGSRLLQGIHVVWSTCDVD